MVCKRCGLVWSDPFPHNPRKFYEEEYRNSYKKTYLPKPKHVIRAGKVALSRYRKISSFLSCRKKIFDVGTGGGEFAYLLHWLGHDVSGIEPNKGYANYSIMEYGIDIQIGFIQEFQTTETFDMITLWHVLEHTGDPCAVLKKLLSMLNPQGVLVVEVPNIEAICQSPKSTFHEAHLFSFNMNTLSRLAEKSGYIVETSFISGDGGNITMFLRRQLFAHSIQGGGLGVSSDADRIIKIIKRHTILRHYMTMAPYFRFFVRIIKAVRERVGIIGFKCGRTSLNKIYLESGIIESSCRIGSCGGSL